MQMNIFTKQKQTYRLKEQTYVYQGLEWGQQDRWGIWDWQVHTALLENYNKQGPIMLHRECY